MSDGLMELRFKATGDLKPSALWSCCDLKHNFSEMEASCFKPS
jgi:hypothetical protein